MMHVFLYVEPEVRRYGLRTGEKTVKPLTLSANLGHGVEAGDPRRIGHHPKYVNPV